MPEGFRRWYDSDPILKEALELLKLQTDDKKSTAADFIISLQEQVAQDVIERIYEITQQFSGKGNRWYDSDPVMLKAIELLRVAPPQTQRIAALKLLLAMESNDMESLEKEDNE
ncbi:TPA: hypothetical protein IAA87_06675 [Candidatus Avigastranaerophilus faecigallinarum]|nr:hypothetical protein [Candidatus Avigastranaerophilus faecigallinarum]